MQMVSKWSASSDEVEREDQMHTYTTSVRTHKVNRLAAAMVARRISPTGAIANAANLPDASLPLVHDPLGALNGHVLAPAAGTWDPRGWVAAPRRSGRLAALEGAGARALVGLRGACAIAGPAAVTYFAAVRLVAALHVGGISRASAVAGCSAAGLTSGFGDTGRLWERLAKEF